MIQITLKETDLPQVEYEKDGAKRSFRIDHNTLFDFIQKNCFEEQVVKKQFNMPVFETPSLPSGTVKYMALPDGKVVLFMEMKESSHDIKYHSTPFEKVPFPNLLFAFSFVPEEGKYRLATKKCFAFKDKVLRDTTQLYKFPFSHVQDNGDMCFFFLTELQDLAQMTSFIHNWMAVEFTDHFYNETNKNKWGAPLRQIFKETQNNPHFSYDNLFEENKTVHDIVDSFVNVYFPKSK